MSSVPDLLTHRPRLIFSLNNNCVLLGSMCFFCLFFSMNKEVLQTQQHRKDARWCTSTGYDWLVGWNVHAVSRYTWLHFFLNLAFRAPEESFGPTKQCLVPPHHEVQVSPAVSRSLTFTPIRKWMAHLFMGRQDFRQITRKTYWQHKCSVSLRCWSGNSCHIEKELTTYPGRIMPSPYWIGSTKLLWPWADER